MSKSRKSLLVVSSAIGPIFVGAAAFGDLSVTVYGNGDATTSPNWPSSPTGAAPTSQVGFDPVIVSGNNGGDGSPYSGSVNDTLSPGSVEAQTFLTGSSGFNLGEIDFVLGGSAVTNSLHLFQLASNITGSSGGYNLSTDEVGPDLLGGGSGLNFTYNGSSGYGINEFVLSGNDEVYLQPNTEYAIELWNPSTNTATDYVQRVIDQAYLNGQAYHASGTGALADDSTVVRGQVSGGGPRDQLFAVYQGPNDSVWTGTAGDGSWATGGFGGNWAGPGTSAATSPTGVTNPLGSSAGVPQNPGDSATFGPTNTSPTLVNLNGSWTVGTINFNSGTYPYTIAQGTGNGTLSLNRPGFAAQISDLSGNHTISAPLAIATSNGLNVSVGQATNTMTLSGAISGTGGLTLSGISNVQAAGTVVLSGDNTYAGGTTVDSGTLVAGDGVKVASTLTNEALPANGAVTIANGTLDLAPSTGLVTTSSLSITGTGQLDLSNNHIIINYGSGADPIASIAALIKSGYAAGAWTGPGIISTAAAANSKSYGIGYADAADKGNPAGLASGQIEIMYTLLGDANLDGKVNGTDFAILATNFNQSVSGWDQGDFNYDGFTNGTDFAFLASNFNQSASQSANQALVAFAGVNGLMADVPEPTTAVVMMGAAGLGMLRRRRRSN